MRPLRIPAKSLSISATIRVSDSAKLPRHYVFDVPRLLSATSKEPILDEVDISRLLCQIQDGDEEARGKLFLVVQQRLHALAGKLMRNERPDHTLTPSALVNEAYLRLHQQGAMDSAENRRYLFGAANRAMRQVLVDHARNRAAKKRGGDLERHPLDTVIENFETTNSVSFLDLEEQLCRLQAESPRQYEIVELRFFAGLTIAETAEVMGCGHSTVEEDWKLARAKLRRALKSD